MLDEIVYGDPDSKDSNWPLIRFILGDPVYREIYRAELKTALAGAFALNREQHDRFGVYGRPVEDYVNLTDVPGAKDTRQQLQTLKAAVFETLKGVTDRDLYSPRYGEQTYWWKQHRRLSLDAYHRVVWHANAHIRQIWCLRGVMGAVDRQNFPGIR